MTEKEFSMKSRMTVDELKNLPDVVMRNMIELKEERLYGTYLSEKDRADLEWEIEFFQKALRDKFEKRCADKKSSKRSSKKEKVAVG